MKSCEEITRDVFAARDAYELRKKERKKKIILAAVPTGSILLAACLCLGVFVILPRTFRAGSSAPKAYNAAEDFAADALAGDAAEDNMADGEIYAAEGQEETVEETAAEKDAEGNARTEAAAGAFTFVSSEEADDYIASCSDQVKTSLASRAGETLLLFTDGTDYAVLTPENEIIFLSSVFDTAPLYSETDDPYAYYCDGALVFVFETGETE